MLLIRKSERTRLPSGRGLAFGAEALPGAAAAPLPEIAEALQALGNRHLRWLRFEQTLEDAFERVTSPGRSRRMWRDGLWTIVLWACCLLLDHFAVHDPMWSRVVGASAATLPLALASNELVRRNASKLLREGSVAVAISVMAGVSVMSFGHVSSAGYAYAQFSAVVCALFAVLVIRLRFPYALAVIVVIWLEACPLTLSRSGLSLAGCLVGCSVTTLASGIMACAAYSMEQEERLIFLLRATEAHRCEALRLANRDLERTANTDYLTGLSNRRTLASALEGAWSCGGPKTTQVAVVLTDIDHFKRLNDSQGHSYGDFALATVSEVIRGCLRDSGDIAVRYGGEEFLALLPGADREVACQVAERIRAAVEEARVPASPGEVEGEWRHLTVSCGVAACIPSGKNSSQDLIKLADEALYEAKARGRNCVVMRD